MKKVAYFFFYTKNDLLLKSETFETFESASKASKKVENPSPILSGVIEDNEKTLPEYPYVDFNYVGRKVVIIADRSVYNSMEGVIAGYDKVFNMYIVKLNESSAERLSQNWTKTPTIYGRFLKFLD